MSSPGQYPGIRNHLKPQEATGQGTPTPKGRACKSCADQQMLEGGDPHRSTWDKPQLQGCPASVLPRALALDW